jgi:hypothetical protein
MTDEAINEIVGDLDLGLKCFIHKTNKTIVSIPDIDNDPDGGEFWQDQMDEIENNSDSYVEIERMGSGESFKTMSDFAATLEASRLKDKIDEVLSRPKPFKNFKAIIDNSGPVREEWFAFKKQYVIEWVKRQLEVNGL